jgi:hypothetical protein
MDHLQASPALPCNQRDGTDRQRHGTVGMPGVVEGSRPNSQDTQRTRKALSELILLDGLAVLGTNISLNNAQAYSIVVPFLISNSFHLAAAESKTQ